MKRRGLLAMGLLLAAVVVERAGFSCARTTFAVQLHDQGETVASIGTIFDVQQGLFLLGMLAGGAAALRLGPRLTAAAALVLAAVGHLANAAGVPLVAGAGIVFVGVGMFRPCLYTAAAEVLLGDDESPSAPAPYRFAAVSAFAVATHAAMSFGGFFGPLQSGLLTGESFGPVHVAAGVETLLAAALAGGAVLLGVSSGGAARPATDAGPYRAAPPVAPRAPMPVALGGLALLLGADTVCWMGAGVSLPPAELYRGTSGVWISMVGPGATLAASAIVFALLLVASIKRWSMPPLHVYGAGLVVVALGLVPIALAGSSSAGLYAVGAAISGLGEAGATGIPLAYAAIAVRGRAATLVVAGWMTVTLVLSVASASLAGIEGLRTPLLVGSAVLCLGAGAAILAFARQLHHGLSGRAVGRD